MLLQILDAQRHRHAFPRTEDVYRNRKLADLSVIENRFFEEQCLAAVRHFHDAVSDFRNFQLYGKRFFDANELACAVEIVEKTA